MRSNMRLAGAAALLAIACAADARSLANTAAAGGTVPFGRHLLQKGICSLTCDSNCAKCTGFQLLGDGTKRVRVDLGACKGGETLSWMCCRGGEVAGAPDFGPAACTRASCAGNVDGPNKCNEVLSSVYVVPAGATFAKVQVHDGKIAGNVDCESGTCCGGAGTSCTNPGVKSGVCEYMVDLTSPTCVAKDLGEEEEPEVGGGPLPLPPVDPMACTMDAYCAANADTLLGLTDAHACAEPKCVSGRCALVPLVQNTVCRAAEFACDVAEVCDGTALFCPKDEKRPKGHQCRAANGVCDLPEVCDGQNSECPTTDVVKDAKFECRPAAGPCDEAEFCDGTSKNCPGDALKPATFVCNAADGPCDEDEYCTGKSVSCPIDAVKAAGTECRPAKGPCDSAEVCDGTTKACPKEDKKHPFGHVCKKPVNACDVPEICDGASDGCPEDFAKDISKAFKCGRTCYFCGVEPDPLLAGQVTTMAAGTYLSARMDAKTYFGLTTLKNSIALGSCNMGSCDELRFLTMTITPDEWKAFCAPGAGVAAICPNGKALSNISHGKCDANTGAWQCYNKQEAPFKALPVMVPQAPAK